MNTFLSPAQQAAKEQYQAFASEHLAKAGNPPCAKDFLQKAGQAGYLGISVPKEYGGQGGSFVEATLFAEAIGEHQAAIALAFAEHTAVAELLNRFGTDTQKSRYLPLLARGECIATTGFHEPTAGSDFKAACASVAKEGDILQITGSKITIVNIKNANIYLVSAKDAAGKLGLYLVDSANNPDSIKFLQERKLLGIEAVPVGDMQLASHKLALEAALETEKGSENCEEQIMFAADIAKTIVAAAALGMMESALKISVDHANTREQFGQKIGQFQAVQWKLADMSAEGSASRMLFYRAACAKDEAPEAFRKEAAMCKWYATKAARVHSGETIQILGAQGLSADSPAEQFYRDAKVLEIAEGTSELQKVIIAEELKV